ncbi:hypothetical protein JOM56_012970 [Amanita muscaria]
MFDEVLFLLPQKPRIRWELLKVLAGIRGEAGGVWAGRTGSRRCLAIFMRSVKVFKSIAWSPPLAIFDALCIAADTSPSRSTNGNQSHESASESESITFSRLPITHQATDPPPLPNLSSEFDADGDIIELDFEETSGLSDMNAFNKAQKKGEEKKLSSSGLESSLPLATNGKAKGQKKTRKEKEVEKREQIENSCSGMRQLLFPILFLVPTSGLRRLSSEQMYISDNLDVHIVTICHEHVWVVKVVEPKARVVKVVGPKVKAVESGESSFRYFPDAVPNSQIVDGDGDGKGSPPDDAAATTDQRSSFHKHTTYDLACVKAIRDVFRRMVGLASALSKEMVPSVMHQRDSFRNQTWRMSKPSETCSGGVQAYIQNGGTGQHVEQRDGLAKVENALVEATATPSVRASMGEKNKVERMAKKHVEPVSNEFGELESRRVKGK